MKRDIPTRSAIIVRHEKTGAKPIMVGGTLNSEASRRLRYDARQEEFEERGGNDKAITQYDEVLMRRSQDEFLAGHQLDYISRMGAWSSKGADRQVDASLWGQHGPVTREDAEAEMMRCGGTYMQSIVSVDRRYAEELGISTKEDMQHLIRDTWLESVKCWGVTKDINEIRWVAAYHTDAPNSLHVHITTWFEGHCLGEGETINVNATRRAKTEVYREGYREISRELSIERSYLRDLTQLQIQKELGLELDEKRLEKVEKLAEEHGFECDIRQTIDAEKMRPQIERIKQRYEEGHGRVSKNYRLHSEAKKLLDSLRKESEPLRESYERYRENLELMADARGLAIPKDNDREYRKEDLEEAKIGITKDREKYIRNMTTDLRNRLSNKIINEYREDKDFNKEIERVSRDLSRQLINESTKIEQNALELSRDKVNAIRDIYRQEYREETAREAYGIVRSSAVLERNIEEKSLEAYERLQERGDTLVKDFDQESFKQKIEERIEERYVDSLSWRKENKALDPDFHATKSLVNMRVSDDWNIVRDGLREQGIRLGLSLHEHEQLKYEIERMNSYLESRDAVDKQDDYRNAPEYLDARDRVTEIIMNSTRVQDHFHDECKRVAREYNIDPKELHDRTMPEFKERIGYMIDRMAEKPQPEWERVEREQERAPSWSRGAGDGLVSALVYEAARAMQRANRRDQERDRQRSRQREAEHDDPRAG